MANLPMFSFCVKCMRPEVTAEVIHEAFENSVIGQIDSIDIVDKTTTLPDDPTKHYKMAFIHLKCWSNALMDNAVREFFLTKVRTTGANIIYDNEGHYITLRENHNPKYKTEPYISYLQSELEYYKNLLKENLEKVERTQSVCNVLKERNEMLIEWNTKISDYNNELKKNNQSLKAQLQGVVQQYNKKTFFNKPEIRLNPSAPRFIPSVQSEINTQVSESHP